VIALLALTACLPDLGPRSVGAHAGRCGSCHPDHAEAYSGSRHAHAATSPLFVALRADAEARQGLGSFCDGCHAPDGGDGISCATCHAAAGAHGEGNGALIADPTGPVRGPFGARDDGPHASERSDFLTDSQLCASCHQVRGPGAFHESPHDHWQRSAAADRGERCQDCHQSPTPGQATPRPRAPLAADGPPRPVSDHGFVGLQVDPGVLLAAGLQLRATDDGVRLTNRAGHRLPDGAAFTRELWLQGRTEGQWLPATVPLHPELLAGGVPTDDPLIVDEIVDRGLAPDEVREVAVEGDEVCLRFRPVAQPLAGRLDLDDAAAITVACVGQSSQRGSQSAP